MSESPRERPDAVDQMEYEHGLVESQIQAINRFPDQNPHPVLRVADDGQLTYANISSEPVRRALSIQVGDVLPAALMERLRAAGDRVYDVWGDTVNLASRMESLGEPGRIQVTPHVAERLKEGFDLTPRGEIEVKGKGPMTSWWLTGRR